MNFFSPPSGYKPADSMTIALATAGGVLVLYAGKIGPATDVQMTASGDPSVNATIKKAGWEAIALVLGMTLLSRDLNVAILGGAAIILEHVTYLHAELANPATGQVAVTPAQYQAASGTPNLAMAAA